MYDYLYELHSLRSLVIFLETNNCKNKYLFYYLIQAPFWAKGLKLFV